MPRMTRRRLMQSSVASLLAANLWPGRPFADDRPTTDFSFIAVNDLHYVDADCGHFFEKVVRHMQDHAKVGVGGKVDFALLVGDIADGGTPAQEAAQRDIFNTLGFPYHVVPGNHDHRTLSDIAGYDDAFPKQYNYAFEHNGWNFVALDTTDGNRSKDTHVQPTTLQWLDAQLPKLDASKPTVLFTHFPMGNWVPMRPVNADDVLERFKPFNLQAIFDGHFHGLTERTVLGGVTATTNKCCSLKRWNHDMTKEKGYFLCHAKDGKITRAFVEVNVPGMIPMPATAPTIAKPAGAPNS